MKLWKVLGVAGVAGVAATGVAVARAERRRRSYGPEDVRARLHERHQEALVAGAAPLPAPPAAGPEANRQGAWRRLRARLARGRRRRRP